MVLFHLPGVGNNRDPEVDLGLVLSVWRGVRKPKQTSSEVSVANCVAFRVCALDVQSCDAEDSVWVIVGRLGMLRDDCWLYLLTV